MNSLNIADLCKMCEDEWDCWACNRKANNNNILGITNTKDIIVLCDSCKGSYECNSDKHYRPPIAFEIPADVKPCRTPCVPHGMMGRSWWKRNGFGSECYCAWEAEVKKQETLNICDLCSFGTYNRKSGGNNAYPLSDGRCCDNCNQSNVIPARMKKCQEEFQEELLKNGGVVEAEPVVDKEKIKLSETKSKTKDANKARDAKKRQKEEFTLQLIEAEKALIAKEIRDRQKKQQKKQQSAKK